MSKTRSTRLSWNLRQDYADVAAMNAVCSNPDYESPTSWNRETPALSPVWSAATPMPKPRRRPVAWPKWHTPTRGPCSDGATRHTQRGSSCACWSYSETWYLPRNVAFDDLGRGSILTCGDVHNNPGPTLRVLQWNMNGGSSHKRGELPAIFADYDMLLISETHLALGKEIKVDGFFYIGRARDQYGGGVAIFLKMGFHDMGISWEKVTNGGATSDSLESISLLLKWEESELRVSSVYMPPAPRNEAIDVATLNSLWPDAPGVAHLLCGDLNVHHPSWDSFVEGDDRGDALLAWADAHGYHIANDPDIPTRTCPVKVGDNRSSPDITMALNCTVGNWTTIVSDLSDHSFVEYVVAFGPNIEDHVIPPRATRKQARFAFSKADWPGYMQRLEDLLAGSPLPLDAYRANAFLSSCILQAAHEFVPKGRRRTTHSIFGILEDPVIVAATEATVAARHTADYALKRNERNALVAAQLRATFQERVSTMAPQDGNSWNLLKSMGAPQKSSMDAVIHFQGSAKTTKRGKANALIKHYAAVGGKGAKPKRIRVGRLRHKVITFAEILNALRHLKAGKAPGKDGIHAEFYMHLGPLALKWLHVSIWRSYAQGTLPGPWKHGVIVPIPKPGKPHEDPASYRPVTLTSIAAKIAERVVGERLVHQVQLATNQLGFRSGRSTSDVTSAMVDSILRCFNAYHPHPARSCGIMYDLTAAFDKVDHVILLKKLKAMGVDSYTLRWIRNFLVSRTSQVRVDDTLSRTRVFSRGVPQGTVLGPILFVCYVNDLLGELSKVENVETYMYADDLTCLAVGDPEVGGTAASCVAPLQRTADILGHWCSNNNMSVSAKTEGILFTSADNTPADRVPITIRCPPLVIGIIVPVVKVTSTSPRLLGVLFDHRQNFGAHAQKVVKAATAATNQLAMIASSSWGPCSHSLRTYYKGYIESVLLYAADTWWPLLAESHKEKLRRAQRRALRIVTGCVIAATDQSLHLEANCPTLDELVSHMVAKKLERDKRAERSDFRRTKADCYPQAKAQSATTQRTRLIPTPQLVATLLLQNVLKPHDAFKEDNIVGHRVAPWDTGSANLVHFSPFVDIDVPKPAVEPAPGSEEEKALNTLKREATLHTLRRIRLGLPKQALKSALRNDPPMGGRLVHFDDTPTTTTIPARGRGRATPASHGKQNTAGATAQRLSHSIQSLSDEDFDTLVTGSVWRSSVPADLPRDQLRRLALESILAAHPVEEELPAAGARNRRKRTLPRKQSRLKRFFEEECWCDAAVHPNGPSAGAACFYRTPGSLRPHHVTHRQCGPDTCSYRGEILTIEHALEDLLNRLLPWGGGTQAAVPPRDDVPSRESSADTLELLQAVSTAAPAPAPRKTPRIRTYRGRHYLIATDSQSSIRALEKGPLAQTGDTEDRIWALLIQLTKMGIHVHFQFVYSHCGVPLNEIADQEAKNAVRGFRTTKDTTPVWLTDVSRRIKRHLRDERSLRAVLTTHREGLLGQDPQEHDLTLPRAASTRFARLRTGESLEIGVFRRRLQLDMTMACRWCCPEAHVAHPPSDDRRTRVQRQITSKEPLICTVCQETCVNAASLRKHYDRRHKNDPYPAWLVQSHTAHNKGKTREDVPSAKPAAPSKRSSSTPPPPKKTMTCPYCNAVDKSQQHVNRCPLKTAPVVRVVPRHLQDGLDGPSETLSHLVYDCPHPALQVIRASMPSLGPNLAKCLRFNNPMVLGFVDRAIEIITPLTTTHTAAVATAATEFGSSERESET